METEATISDVLEAVNKGFSGVQEQFVAVQKQIDGLTQDVTAMKAVMVTKDYLDEKLGRQDGKINALVNVLERKSVITAEDKRTVLA